MPFKTKLTDQDFCNAAHALNCEPEAVKAIATVESKRAGFYSDGFPVILFERHKFWKNAPKAKREQWKEEHPDICHPSATPRGGYGDTANQRRKYAIALAWSKDAANKACSWGFFQELGENCGDYGLTIDEFVALMKQGADGHLEIFVKSIKKRGIAKHLKSRNWEAFAKNYNGPSFKTFSYDTKMANAFATMPKIKCVKDSSLSKADPPVAQSGNQVVEPPPIAQPQDEVSKIQESATSEGGKETLQITTKNEQDVNDKVVQDKPAPYNEIGLKQTLINDAKPFLPANGGLQMFSEYAQQATGWPPWVVALIGKAALIVLVITAVWFLYRIASWLVHCWKENERVKLTAMINTDVTRKNIEFK